MGSKRVVVVVHDTSKEVNWTAIRGIVRNLSLKAGDELIVLGVVHQFNNSTTTSAFLGIVKLCKFSIQNYSILFINSSEYKVSCIYTTFRNGSHSCKLGPMF